jgi:fused signal recognition particle receptor
MNELSKMKRVIQKSLPHAPQETLLVIDATTGQNGMRQAEVFNEATEVSGIVLTKLDGTAKGGIVLAIRHMYHLPIKYIGLGEKIDDLVQFDIEQYIYGLFRDFF